jgi:hypothetical protein
VIGSEYACTFAAIGTEVHLIDGRHELLPYLDKEVSAALGKACTPSSVKIISRTSRPKAGRWLHSNWISSISFSLDRFASDQSDNITQRVQI